MKKRLLFVVLALTLTLSLAMFAGCNLEDIIIDTPDESTSSSPVEEPHVHSFSEWEIVTQPTCSAAGEMKRVCTDPDCDEYQTSLIAKGNHVFGKDGLCSFCGKVDGFEVKEDGTLEISSANGLMVLAEQKGVSKIDVVADIDMTDKAWVGLFTNPHFAESGITINGNGYSISHLCAPLVASTTYNVTINELTIKDSEMAHSHKNAGFGAFVQYADYPDGGIVTLNKCHLVNSKLITTDDTRVGGLIGVVYGRALITDCTVENCELSAFGAVGGIVGQTGDTAVDAKVEITNCTVKNTKLNSIDDGGWRVGAIVGSANQIITCINNCTSTDNTLTQTDKTAPDHELYGRKVNGGMLEIDGVAYVTAASFKKILTDSVEVTLDKDYFVIDAWESLVFSTDDKRWHGTYSIDGDNHTISGLTMPLLGPNAAQYISVANLTIKNSDIGSKDIVNEYNSGAFVAFADAGVVELKLENCHTENVNVVGKQGDGSSAGSLVGYTSVQKLVIKNCTVKGGSVTNQTGNAAGVVGFVQTFDTFGDHYVIEGCTVEGCKITGEKVEKTGTIVGTVVGDEGKGYKAIIRNNTASGCTTDLEGVDGPGVCGRTVHATVLDS